MTGSLEPGKLLFIPRNKNTRMGYVWIGTKEVVRILSSANIYTWKLKHVAMLTSARDQIVPIGMIQKASSLF